MSFSIKPLLLVAAMSCIACASGGKPADPGPSVRTDKSTVAERGAGTIPLAPSAAERMDLPATEIPATHGATLREAVDRFLAAEHARGPNAAHVIERIDLNGDRREDALVLMRSRRYCGSRGCLLLVFERTGRGYELQSRLLLGRTPMIASDTRTAGWRDLVAPMTTGGAGMRLVVLKHQNGAYPANAERLATVPPTRKVSGRVLFSDD